VIPSASEPCSRELIHHCTAEEIGFHVSLGDGTITTFLFSNIVHYWTVNTVGDGYLLG